MKKKYPNSVYTGIHADPETWGMCCSYEAARKCAEQYYDIYERKDHPWSVFFGVNLFLLKWLGICFFCDLPVIVAFYYTDLPYSCLFIALPILVALCGYCEYRLHKATHDYHAHGLSIPYDDWRARVVWARGFLGAVVIDIILLGLNGML